MDESKHRKDNDIIQDGMWMVVELLGHNKLAGYVTEEQKWGQALLRIDIPTLINNGKMVFTTQWYGTHALYCATPVTKEAAIVLAKDFRRLPYDQFDLKKEDSNNLDEYDPETDDIRMPF